MLYLFLQTWIWMIAAALVGLAIGRLLWRGQKITDPRAGELESLRLDLETSERKRAELEAVNQSLQGEGESQRREIESAHGLLERERQALSSMREQLEQARKAAATPAMEKGPGVSADRPPEPAPELDREPESSPVPEPEESPDDLQRIRGIGPVMEKSLNRMGVFYFRQIADLNEEQIRYVNKRLGFYGRIEREEWMEQARKLLDEDG